jgi:hypothetical protein
MNICLAAPLTKQQALIICTLAKQFKIKASPSVEASLDEELKDGQQHQTLAFGDNWHSPDQLHWQVTPKDVYIKVTFGEFIEKVFTSLSDVVTQLNLNDIYTALITKDGISVGNLKIDKETTKRLVDAIERIMS